MTPGSTLWLIAHESRLAWRAGAARNRWARFVLLGVGLLLIGGIGGPIGLVLRDHRPTLTGLGVATVGLLLAFVVIMIFSTALSFIAASFVDCGDMDLLLSSPLPARRLLTIRLLAAAMRSITLWMLLFGPPIVMIACIAGARWLGGLALLLAGGLVGTSAASWLALGLFRLIGPRRAKTTATVITSLAGLTMGLVPTLLNQRMAAIGPDARRLIKQLSALPPSGPLAWPAQAVFGDPSMAALLIALALALFLATAWLLAPSFAIVATRNEAVRRKPAGRTRLRGFGAGPFRLLLVKDYRLLLRNHAALLQILARSVAFVPLLMVNLTGAGPGASIARVAVAGTLVLGQTTGALVWAFVGVETQADLLASAPLPPGLFRRSRFIAALAPVVLILLLAAATAASWSPMTGLAILTMGSGACLSSAMVSSFAMPSRSRRVWSNMPRISGGAVLADMIACGFWSGAAYLLAEGSIWTPLPVWLAISTVWLWYEIFVRRSQALD